MNIEAFREYCLQKKGVTEDLPFDEHTLTYKVMGKIFAITSLNAVDFSVNLKCDPDRALALRESYEEIKPGYHMNKKHWNTVYLHSEAISLDLVREMIDHSYDLVVKKLTKKNRDTLLQI